MNLYLISQEKNTDYDTFDSAVVCASSEYEARNIHPEHDPSRPKWPFRPLVSWVPPEDVSVRYIGKAAHSVQRGVVLASFNAG